ncbi:MAG: MotA/TolQ/ExbB proton channel family protein [Chitinispirillaceae bacterium]|nr:MotA/TolQ/ExbB proton channel family protein [Chitinispirillaceae bacterium]
MISSIAAWFNAGGPYMWVILGVCAIAIAVAADRFIYYYLLCRTDPSRLQNRIMDVLTKKSADRFTFLKKGRSPLFVLLQTAVDRFEAGAPMEQIEEGVEEASIKELPKITRRISYLSLFANIATLVGLLGTIAGLQQSFGSLASAEASQKAALLAAGIAQAMNTTAFGLIVAVPCMALFTFLNNKQQSLINDIDDTVVRIVNTMKTVRA